MGLGKSTKPVGLLAVLAVGVLMISCSQKAQYPLSRLDTPEHHTFAGIVLLDREKITDAGREFELALRLDPRYAKAYAGAGLVKAYRGDFAGGLDAIRQSQNYARSKEERIFALVGVVRVNTLSHTACLKIGTECGPDDAWFRRSKEAFEQAVLIDPKDASAYYFMGECYLAALDMEPAGRMYSRVLDLNTEYVYEADRRWKLIRKIYRAMPETVAGRKAALVERLTRADVAVLFVEEMKIGALLAQRTPKALNTGSRDPGKTGTVVFGQIAAKDIAGHPLSAPIEGIIQIGIRGLDVYPDGTFRPDELVDRAGYAMMIEDILAKAIGDPALATRFAGSPSPFPDLRGDVSYFNSAMVVTSRGIMEVEDAATGSFAPFGLLSGVDALVVIRNLRRELR
jgi:tetratricopeptide (TPR) repeat protein